MRGIIQEIKDKLHLLDYVKTIYEVKRRGAGIYRVMLCPLPGCKGTDSFTVFDETDTFKCFSCGHSGDILELYQQLARCDLQQAIMDLAQRAGIQYNKKSQSDFENDHKLKRAAAEYFHQALLKNKAAMDYLRITRRLTPETIDKFQIGAATGDLVDHLKKKGADMEAMQRVGLANDKEHDYWGKDMLLFPHYWKGYVSHFSAKVFRGDDKRRYQSKKEHRIPDCLFYGQDMMLPNQDILYVEGEFDRITVIQQTGFQGCVAINGSISKEQIDYMASPEMKLKRHYLLFDNDEAGISYSYRIMDGGDFRGFTIIRCQPRKKYKDIDDELRDCKDPKQALGTIIREGKRLSADTYRIEESGGYYSVWRPGSRGGKGRQERTERITNFLIDLRRRYELPDGVHREVMLINEHGEVSVPALIPPKELLGIEQFKARCVGIGNFIFEGKGGDLNTLWQYLFARESGSPVYEEDHIGYLKNHDIWLFGNCAVKDEKIIMTDEEGIMWSTTKGFRPCAGRAIDLSEQERILFLPALQPHDRPWEEMYSFMDLLKENVGGYEGWMALAWFLACVFSEEIYSQYRLFPLLFLYGKAQSGKNTLASILAQAWGLSDSDFILLSEATQTGISRRMAYYSSMPLVLDEYRASHPRIKAFDGFLRGIYNRIGAVKAEREGTTATRQVVVRGAACLLGEQTPSDTALRQRCLTIRLLQTSRRDDLLPQVKREAQHLSGFLLRLIQERKTRLPQIMQTIQRTAKVLEQAGHDARHAINYAIPCAVIANVLGKGPRLKKFISWVEGQSQQEQESKIEETPVMRFIEDLLTLKQRKIIKDNDVFFERSNEREKALEPNFMGRGYIYFSNCYNLWQIECRKQGVEAWPKQSLMDQIREEWWYEGRKSKRYPVDQKPRSSICVKIYDEPRYPSSLAYLFDVEVGEIEQAKDMTV